MIDVAGTTPAAAESILPLQNREGAAAAAYGDAQEPVVERPKETARASIDRAFAVLEDEDAGDGAERDERGRFKAKALLDVGPDALGNDTTVPAGGNAEPPARFSPDAKAAWATAPESVRAETHRALKELSDGLGQYQQVFEPLKPFYQLAEKFDTTVHETLERYVGLDFALLSKKPEERLGAIEQVLDYAGISPKEYAAFIMGQKPGEAQSQNDRTIRGLRQEIADLKNQMGGVSQSLQQRRQDETLKQVEAFADENPRLKEAEFQELVFRLLSTRMAEDLKGAYDMAERLNPAAANGAQRTTASTAAFTKPNPAHTRNGNLSITGGPGSGSNPTKRKAPATARESVDSAFASLGLG